MADTYKWNQPAGKKSPRAAERKASGMWYILVALAVATGITAWFLKTPNEKPKESPQLENKPTKIADVAPNIPKHKESAQPIKSKSKVEKPKTRPPQRVGELRDGYRLLPDGTLHRVLGIITNTPPKMSLADKTFSHSADVELGNLLMVEPGDDLLGSAEGLYRGFGKELDEALAEPISYDKDDTDLQRELKDGVKELRDELQRRRAAGEDVEKVMEDTWNQMKELSLYRQELEDQVRELSTDDLTQKDYEDLVTAANKMLSDRGIKPLEMPATLKHTLRLRKMQAEAVEKQKERKNANEAE